MGVGAEPFLPSRVYPNQIRLFSTYFLQTRRGPDRQPKLNGVGSKFHTRVDAGVIFHLFYFFAGRIYDPPTRTQPIVTPSSLFKEIQIHLPIFSEIKPCMLWCAE
jgi:hypothetical protein